MKKLTENQKLFLLKYFFKNEKYAGWKNIAIQLLEKGKCVTAGRECIWTGGIGNFIKISDPGSEYIDCVLYTFDLNYFLSSSWYKEIKELYLYKLLEDTEKIKKELENIEERAKDIYNLKEF